MPARRHTETSKGQGTAYAAGAARGVPWTVEPGGLTDAHRERIAALIEEGWKAPSIAREIRKHPSTVQWYLYASGLRAPEHRPNAQPYRRGERWVYPFSPGEDALIEILRTEGLGFGAIAEQASARFGTVRSYHTIRCRLVMLGARDDDAEAA